MTDMQRTRDVRRWNHDRVGPAVTRGVRTEQAGRYPTLIASLLNICGLVLRGKLAPLGIGHGTSLRAGCDRPSTDGPAAAGRAPVPPPLRRLPDRKYVCAGQAQSVRSMPAPRQ